MARHLSQTHQRSTTPTATNPVEGYKSPKHKLVRFFEKSRNQWKAKCLNAKAIIKRLQNRIRFLEKSKEQLKHRVSELEADLNTLKRLLQAKDHELEQVKKDATPPLVVHQDIDAFRQRIPRHTYSVGHVMWFVSCLLYTSPSPRDGLLSRIPSSA